MASLRQQVIRFLEATTAKRRDAFPSWVVMDAVDSEYVRWSDEAAYELTPEGERYLQSVNDKDANHD